MILIPLLLLFVACIRGQLSSWFIFSPSALASIASSNSSAASAAAAAAAAQSAALASMASSNASASGAVAATRLAGLMSRRRIKKGKHSHLRRSRKRDSHHHHNHNSRLYSVLIDDDHGDMIFSANPRRFKCQPGRIVALVCTGIHLPPRKCNATIKVRHHSTVRHAGSCNNVVDCDSAATGECRSRCTATFFCGRHRRLYAAADGKRVKHINCGARCPRPAVELQQNDDADDASAAEKIVEETDEVEQETEQVLGNDDDEDNEDDEGDYD